MPSFDPAKTMNTYLPCRRSSLSIKFGGNSYSGTFETRNHSSSLETYCRSSLSESDKSSDTLNCQAFVCSLLWLYASTLARRSIHTLLYGAVYLSRKHARCSRPVASVYGTEPSQHRGRSSVFCEFNRLILRL